MKTKLAELLEEIATRPAPGFGRDAFRFPGMRAALDELLARDPFSAWTSFRKNPIYPELLPAVADAADRARRQRDLADYLKDVEETADPLCIPLLVPDVEGPAQEAELVQSSGVRVAAWLASRAVGELQIQRPPDGGADHPGTSRATALVRAAGGRVGNADQATEENRRFFWCLVRELLRVVAVHSSRSRRGDLAAARQLAAEVIGTAAEQLSACGQLLWGEEVRILLRSYRFPAVAVLVQAAEENTLLAEAAHAEADLLLREALEGTSSLIADPIAPLGSSAHRAFAMATLAGSIDLKALVESTSLERGGFGFDALRWAEADERVAVLLWIGAWCASVLQERGDRQSAAVWADWVVDVLLDRLPISQRHSRGSEASARLPVLAVELVVNFDLGSRDTRLLSTIDACTDVRVLGALADGLRPLLPEIADHAAERGRLLETFYSLSAV